MKNKKETTEERLENQLMSFIFMCPLEEKKLFLREPKEKTMEDYMRLICLATVFELNGAYLKLYAELEEIDKFNKFFEYLNSLDFETVEKWVEDFIERIEEPEVSELAKAA